VGARKSTPNVLLPFLRCKSHLGLGVFNPHKNIQKHGDSQAFTQALGQQSCLVITSLLEATGVKGYRDDAIHLKRVLDPVAKHQTDQGLGQSSALVVFKAVNHLLNQVAEVSYGYNPVNAVLAVGAMLT